MQAFLLFTGLFTVALTAEALGGPWFAIGITAWCVFCLNMMRKRKERRDRRISKIRERLEEK
jgi:hypothetical protein